MAEKETPIMIFEWIFLLLVLSLGLLLPTVGCKKAISKADEMRREMSKWKKDLDDRYGCSYCGGLKSIPCPACWASGVEVQMTPYGPMQVPCSNCGGGRTVPCQGCHGLGYH